MIERAHNRERGLDIDLVRWRQRGADVPLLEELPEHIANWCVCGYTESHQFKRVLLAVSYAKGVLFLYVSWRMRVGTASRALVVGALMPNAFSPGGPSTSITVKSSASGKASVPTGPPMSKRSWRMTVELAPMAMLQYRTAALR